MKIICASSLALLLIAAFADQLPVISAEQEVETKLMEEYGKDCLEVCLEIPDIECASCLFATSGSPGFKQLLSAIATVRTELMCDNMLSSEESNDENSLDDGFRSKRQLTPMRTPRRRRPRPPARMRSPRPSPRMRGRPSPRMRGRPSPRMRGRPRRPPRPNTPRMMRGRPASPRMRVRPRTPPRPNTPRRSRGRGRREVHKETTAGLNEEDNDYFETTIDLEDQLFDLFVALIRDCNEQCSFLTSCEKKWSPCVECLVEKIKPGMNEYESEFLKIFGAYE